MVDYCCSKQISWKNKGSFIHPQQQVVAKYLPVFSLLEFFKLWKIQGNIIDGINAYSRVSDNFGN